MESDFSSSSCLCHDWITSFSYIFVVVFVAEIIDDIDGRMDQANTRLIKETHHVKRITAKSSACGKL